MTNKIEVGSFVEVLDDSFKGKVVKIINNNEAVVLTNDGFELTYFLDQLIPAFEDSLLKQGSSFSAIESAKSQKIVIKHHKVNTEKKSKKEEFTLEIDLHIEKLVKNFKHLTNFDILNIQIDTARHQLEFAITRRIPKIVFIHGMGEGVLKTELEYLFGRYSQITFKDANYRKYGLGATEIHIKQKSE
ncbi:DNA mismatch repair protein MutS [Myroides sp. JBRI-B21084]|uniref:Smr/MutS family protein n=1 Tax=Myroides sp. JBRI-B21084 TaxID=3119977 RepID=UPI0026E3242A|nr:Smr/MutS family protein [Paenimyroides cloacae]WKW45813.1 DNA mismatch repair protein MutS [Paenimyroides cloacae]